MKIVIDTNWLDRPTRRGIDNKLGPEGWGLVVDLWMYAAQHCINGDLGDNLYTKLDDEQRRHLYAIGILEARYDGQLRLRMPPVLADNHQPAVPNSAVAINSGITSNPPSTTMVADSNSSATVDNPATQEINGTASIATAGSEAKNKIKRNNERESNHVDDGDDATCLARTLVKDEAQAHDAARIKDEASNVVEGTTEPGSRSIATPNYPCKAKSERTNNNLEALHCKRNHIDIKKIINIDNKNTPIGDVNTSIGFEAMCVILENTFKQKVKIKWKPLLKSICPVKIKVVQIAAEEYKSRLKPGDSVNHGYYIRILEEVVHGFSDPEKPRYSKNKPTTTVGGRIKFSETSLTLLKQLDQLIDSSNHTLCFLSQCLSSIIRACGDEAYNFVEVREAILELYPEQCLPEKKDAVIQNPWHREMIKQQSDDYWQQWPELQRYLHG